MSLLRQYTTFRIGGPADLFYDATSTEDLAGAVTAARELGIEYFVLGLGANILVGDKGFRGLVIRNTSSHLKFFDDGQALGRERCGDGKADTPGR